MTLARRLHRARAELARFGTIGLLAYVIDTGLFNLLANPAFGPLADKPLTAKLTSVLAATAFAYLGNRTWTYRGRTSRPTHTQILLFAGVNAGAIGIALVCLWFSHYALGLDNALADNIAANIVGVGLGTAFRFWAYRTWVFPPAAVAVLERDTVSSR